MATTRPAAGRTLLPVLGQPSPERADAARNRRALLAAAHTIMVECGIDALNMDRVAAAAGVDSGVVLTLPLRQGSALRVGRSGSGW